MDRNRRHAASRRAWIFIALLSAVPAAASAQEVCALPATIERASPKRVDYVNKDLPTDYLALVLSWSPEHCETQRNRPEGQRQKQSFQCFSGNRFEWVVHGLWPQNGQARSGRDHPRNCEAAGAVPASVLKQHLCMMPGVELMQNEWQAHGTCGWRSPSAISRTSRLCTARCIAPPCVTWRARTPTCQPPARRHGGDVKQAFLRLNPTLPADSLRVSVASNNRLRELWVCLGRI